MKICFVYSQDKSEWWFRNLEYPLCCCAPGYMLSIKGLQRSTNNDEAASNSTWLALHECFKCGLSWQWHYFILTYFILVLQSSHYFISNADRHREECLALIQFIISLARNYLGSQAGGRSIATDTTSGFSVQLPLFPCPNFPVNSQSHNYTLRNKCISKHICDHTGKYPFFSVPQLEWYSEI